MKSRINEILNGTTRKTSKSVLLIPFTLLLIILPLSLMTNSHESPPVISAVRSRSSLNSTTESESEDGCDIFSGTWVPYPEGPYYNHETCPWILDQQNCIKFGRPDTDFMHWRWKPDQCELPLFDADQFLKLVKGKKMVFVGDSVGKNQMWSLLCLLNHVSEAEDLSERYSSNPMYFKRYYFEDYNFTLANLWSPYFVKARDDDPDQHTYNNIMRLYLDEADEAWTNQVADFDIVIFSAGHWFFRPLLFFENNKLVGCNQCDKENVTDLTYYYGYRKAFRTAFKAITNLKRYNGMTFLRTFSPSHFENGDWNKGGNCKRTKPFTKEEIKLDGFMLETYLTQVDEFKAAQKEARKKGLKFMMLDTTEIMLLRPDGHPNNYGHSKDKNTTLNDCVHWCLPGPVDTWNELLQYMMNLENQDSSDSIIQRIF
ncbi:protein trichome birefringence-like 19 [Arachis stenosperma]|uniref:protein trichome birefringence-like 19 n=1 Tax=Arachis stenosperma TaxID=217475 RepID=UPI0025AC2883|nr:protein trichome birefringence-like 19 [Arachis stenosperma]